MKKILLIIGLLLITTFCFAQYYAEYSFNEYYGMWRSESGELDGHVYFKGGFNGLLTRADIQKLINDYNNLNYRDARVLADFLGRMLRASSDKCIFIIEPLPESQFFSKWLFIKVGNGYMWSATGA
jgi:hypothetical protein